MMRAVSIPDIGLPEDFTGAKAAKPNVKASISGGIKTPRPRSGSVESALNDKLAAEPHFAEGGLADDHAATFKEVDKVWDAITDGGGPTADATDFYLNLAEMLPDVAEELGEDCFLCAFNALDPDGDGEVLETVFKEHLRKEMREHPGMSAHDVFKQFVTDEAKIGLDG